MRVRHIIFTVLFLGVFAHGFLLYSQRNESDKRYPLAIDLNVQPDSPIRLVFDSVSSGSGRIFEVAVDNLYPQQPANIVLILENVSGSQIIAYALVSKGNGFHNVQVNTLVKPLWPGNNLRRGFGTGGSESIEYSLDYVLFSDGRSWGPDKFGRSKQMTLYFDGRNAALEQLRILSATYPNPQDFLEQASNFGGFLSSDPAGDPDSRKIDSQYRLGWIHIVEMLRANQKRQVESKQLADRLESAIPNRH